MFIFLSFSAPPEITSPANDTWEIMAGESVTIECLAESDPSPSYVWKNTAGAVVADGRQLRLHKVNDSSGGNYICTATNRLGSDDRSIIVLVRSKLFFSFYISSTYWQRACFSRKPQQKKDKNTSDENYLLLICAILMCDIWYCLSGPTDSTKKIQNTLIRRARWSQHYRPSFKSKSFLKITVPS